MSDDNKGERVETPSLTEADSAIKVGDAVIFRVRRDLFMNKPVWPKLTGTVTHVLPGHELTYVIRVHAGKLPWLPQFVRAEDIARVSFDGIRV